MSEATCGSCMLYVCCAPSEVNTTIGGGIFGMGGGQNHRGSGGRESPAGSRGGALVGVWGRSPPEAEEILKLLQAHFLVVFHTFHLYMPIFFSVFAGIIPLSLRNGMGAFDTVPPPRLQVGNGATAPQLHRL